MNIIICVLKFFFINSEFEKSNIKLMKKLSKIFSSKKNKKIPSQILKKNPPININRLRFKTKNLFKRGKWDINEHNTFIKCYLIFGNDWKKVLYFILNRLKN